MSRLVKKQQILHLLAANLDTPQPMVVHSEIIASKLQMSIEETCQLMKIMDQMGMVVTDMEGSNTLITQKGLSCVSL